MHAASQKERKRVEKGGRGGGGATYASPGPAAHNSVAALQREKVKEQDKGKRVRKEEEKEKKEREVEGCEKRLWPMTGKEERKGKCIFLPSLSPIVVTPKV